MRPVLIHLVRGVFTGIQRQIVIVDLRAVVNLYRGVIVLEGGVNISLTQSDVAGGHRLLISGFRRQVGF